MHNYDVGKSQRVKQTFSILNFSVFLLNKEIYLSFSTVVFLLMENMPNIQFIF